MIWTPLIVNVPAVTAVAKPALPVLDSVAYWLMPTTGDDEVAYSSGVTVALFAWFCVVFAASVMTLPAIDWIWTVSCVG